MQVLHRPHQPDEPTVPEAGTVERIAPDGRAPEPTERRRVDRAGALVVVGSFVTMVGLIGDLLVHALSSANAGQTLFVVGVTNPWSLVVFLGIVLTGLGGIVWASRLSGDFGALLGTAMVLILAFVLILGAWSGVRANQRTSSASSASGTGSGVGTGATGAGAGTGGAGAVGSGGANGSGSQGIHNHDTTGAAAGALAGEGTGSEGAAQFGGHSHGEAGPTSDLEARQGAAMLAQAKAATARFRNIAYAKSHGYQQVTQFIPTLGLHLANLDLLNKPFDPVHPAILLYQPTGSSGGLHLVGVAYSEPASTNPPIGFPGGDDVWHYHTNLCFLATGDVTISPSAAACKARHGYFQARTPWLLHAWIWEANPDGVFTEENPLVF
jgi:hypothetical protein